MRKFLILVGCMAVFVIGTGSAFAISNDKPPAPPGQGECEHGNSGKPCKPDPQPEHGKDCDEHGPKEGGVNEDHCKGETTPPPTTTTETTTTTPTTPTVPTTPTTPPVTQPPATVPPVTTAPPAATTPAPVVPVVVPKKNKPPVTKKALQKALKKQAEKNGANSGAPVHVQRAGELPNTGLPLGAVILMGLGMVGTGLKLRKM